MRTTWVKWRGNQGQGHQDSPSLTPCKRENKGHLFKVRGDKHLFEIRRTASGKALVQEEAPISSEEDTKAGCL